MIQEVLVFKTNIRSEADKLSIADVLTNAQIIQWTVDLEDCDAVLRVVTSGYSPREIIESITNKGYSCSELTD